MEENKQTLYNDELLDIYLTELLYLILVEK